MRSSKYLLSILTLVLAVSSVEAQYFALPGRYLYSVSPFRPVFDVSPDGKIGVSLANDPVQTHPARLTSFDPIFGTQLDSKTFGFGPLGVQMVQTTNGLRVVVLTSQGGPRTIYLFDLAPTGQLTQLASTQLTTSIDDSGSNLALSGSAQVGFVFVSTGSGLGTDLVTFSLVDGSILNRSPTSATGDTLILSEASGKRTLAFLRNLQTLRAVDVLNPSQPILLGDIPLTPNGESSGMFSVGIAFSNDGRYVFVGDNFADFAAIDLSTLQVIATIGGLRFDRVRIFEDSQRRLLMLHTSRLTGTPQPSLLLVNATDPFHLSVIGQYFTTETLGPESDFAFSSDASRLYIVMEQGMRAFDLPGFAIAWQQPHSGLGSAKQIRVYGPTDEVLGAWSGQDSSILGAFPANPPSVSITNDTSVAESNTAAAVFTIQLSAASNHRITVSYATADGTAVETADYTRTTGSVIFEPGETTKTISVPVSDDTMDELDESFSMNISNSTVGSISRSPGTGTIVDNDPPPSVSIGDYSLVEGESAGLNAAFTVSLSARSGKPISLNYSTADGTAVAGSDYSATSGTASFEVGQTTATILVPILGDRVDEPDETFLVIIANPVNVTTNKSQGTGTIQNDDLAAIRLSAPAFFVSENSSGLTVTVFRGGDFSTPATIDYATSDTSGANNCNVANGAASSRCDYLTRIGTLHFPANRGSLTISIPIVNDSYGEGSETFTIKLSNPVGTGLIEPSTATITIIDNETGNGVNPIATQAFFVRQHYIDFLNRAPDTPGLNFWIDQINSCGSDAQCVEVRRVNVSASFFLSIEFQDTGYLVERIYKASYGDVMGTSTIGGTHQLSVPVVRLGEFLPDAQQIGQGVIVGQPGWETALENNKQAFTVAFVQRARFMASLPISMTPAEFVDKLNLNAGNPLSVSERNQLVADLGSSTKTRAQVLRAVAEDPDLVHAESNRAFVLMQYFGYLRRNPNDPQDTDHSGYDFWLTKLNLFNGNFINAEMVKAFLSSIEYRQRFGP